MYQDISQLFHDVRSNWKVVSDHYQYARSKFFYRDEFISMLLFNRSQRNLPKTAFIDYNAAFSYYGDAHKQFTLQYQDQERSITIPYTELINFVTEPDATVSVDSPLGAYELPPEIANDTNDLFRAYVAQHPHVTDGPTLKLASFKQTGPHDYHAELQSASYFSEIRTTLGLDYPLDNDFLDTMRLQDLGPNNELRPVEESRMVNDIGVCTVLAFRSSGHWYFHMMPRHKNIGVFSGMLSSVGGTVEPPKEQISNLVDYVTGEIVREIREETGLDVNQLHRERRCQVIPLAFLRELSRGGHPQFFYLTVMDEMTDKELGQAFKNAEWKHEFRSDMFSNINSLDDVVSPEFSSCLLYALSYLQKRRKIPGDTLRLE